MQWEYKTTTLAAASAGILKNKVDVPALDGLLNQLGVDRWELVSTFVLQGEVMRDVVAVFKRPILEREGVTDLRGACPKCGYDLRGTEHNVCPECGWHARHE